MTKTSAPVKAPALPYTFKANLSEYRRRMGVMRIILAFIISLALYFRFGLIVWIISVICITFFLIVLFYLLSTRTITLKSDSLVYRNGLGKRRTVLFESIESAKVFLNYYEPTFGIFPRISIGMKKGAPISIVSTFWTLVDMERTLVVLKDKKVLVEYYEEPVSYPALAKQFPSYVTYIERHPIQLTFIILGVILVIAVAIALWNTFGE